MFQQILDRNPKVSYRTVVSIVSISYKLAQHILTKNLGPFSFKRNKTGAINPYTIEKRVKSGKELTGSFKFVQDWKFCTYGGTFITFHKVYSQSTPLNSASVKLGSLGKIMHSDSQSEGANFKELQTKNLIFFFCLLIMVSYSHSFLFLAILLPWVLCLILYIWWNFHYFP